MLESASLVGKRPLAMIELMEHVPAREALSELVDRIYGPDLFEKQARANVEWCEKQAATWQKVANEVEEIERRPAEPPDSTDPVTAEDVQKTLRMIDGHIELLEQQISVCEGKVMDNITSALFAFDRGLGDRMNVARMTCASAARRVHTVFKRYQEFFDDSLDQMAVEEAENEQGDAPYEDWSEIVEKHNL